MLFSSIIVAWVWRKEWKLPPPKTFFAPHVEVAHVITVHGTAVRAGADKVVFGIVFAVETAVLRLLGFMTQQGFV